MPTFNELCPEDTPSFPEISQQANENTIFDDPSTPEKTFPNSDSSFPNLLEVSVYLRIKQIIGDPKADPPILPLIPVSRSTWWAGVKTGKFPAPVKLSPRCTAWRTGDIRHLIETLNERGGRDD